MFFSMKFSLSAQPLSRAFLSFDTPEPLKRSRFWRAAGPFRRLVAGD
jgi:hypothetical protein